MMSAKRKSSARKSTLTESRLQNSVRTTPWALAKIVSGGQTGVDRAALDAAIELKIPHGGWCPLGRVSELGTIPKKYKLVETITADYPERTEKNVVDSDGTLILFRGKLSGGTELTRKFAVKHRKPCCLVDLDQPMLVNRPLIWMKEHRIQVLNVAGPRESSSPGVYAKALHWLRDFFKEALAE
jgi:Circularly permutated YpsA SLOG family